jgi:hypothetical protein
MAPIISTSPDDAPGLLYEDIWDTAVLTPFDLLLNPEELHCLVLAASEGYSCVIASATPQLYLEEANPLFFPSGELICGTVNIGADATTYHSFLLPEICSPPLGLVWPTDIGFDKFKESIQALGHPFKPFLHTIERPLHPT